jgi:hypothetical protein
VDYDGDGHADLISGSYDPGEFYLFRGLGKGQFKARETLCDKNGKPVLTHPEVEDKVGSFGSWVAMVDWEDDGDLDLVLGGYAGEMLVRLNEGTRAKPAFATANVPVQADGKDLMVPGHHATPVVADWDGDGRWDLLSGSENGGVYWFRNVGKAGQPRFAAPVTLVPPHDGHGYNELLDVEPVPGIRSQIAVADYNGDGKLDLLLGDFCTNVTMRKDLTPDEQKQLAVVREKKKAVETALREQNAKVDEALKEFLKGIPKADLGKKEVQAKANQKWQDLRKTPEFKKVVEDYQEQDKAFNQFLSKPKNKHARPDDLSTPHGYVWLFLRK